MMTTTSMMMTVMMTTAAPTTDDRQPGGGARIVRCLLSSVRTRLVFGFAVLLALAGLASVVIARQVLEGLLDERIDRDLVQEAEELRKLAGGNDPETGEPFDGRVRRIFHTYLQGNIPSRNEAMISFVNGEPFERSRAVLPYRLDRDPRIVDRWATLQRSGRGAVDTPEGLVEFLAVPVRARGETRGVFVIAFFRDLERAQIDPAVAAATIIAAIAVLVGSVLAWRMAGRILTPVGEVRDTALAISESDLTRRIDVKGGGEIADLARTFNQMLERLDEAFTGQKRFIDDVAHELRTPITIIRGHLELLEEDPAERDQTVDLVLDELDRMSRFVDDLLLLARSERPDFLDLDTVDIARLTEEVHRKAEALAPRRWQVDSLGPGRIVADRQRVTQALMQIAQNAVAHTKENDLLKLGSSVTNGEARWWVSDCGPGISAQDQRRIFERFESGAGSKRSGGLGLGLPIVKAIADAHHGKVEVVSRPGEGTTFTIVIPLDQPDIGDMLQ
ncbi:MAG: sensor histidine kinase [Actinomycetota bacterium]